MDLNILTLFLSWWRSFISAGLQTRQSQTSGVCSVNKFSSCALTHWPQYCSRPLNTLYWLLENAIDGQMGSLFGASMVSVPFYEMHACQTNFGAAYSNNPDSRGTNSVLALVRREPACESFQGRAMMSGVLHAVFGVACAFAHPSFHSASSPIV